MINHKEELKMMLTKWTPLRNMDVFQNHFSRFFDDSVWPASREDSSIAAAQWNPAVDIYETDNAIVINADLPGIDKEGISIDFKDQVLTIRGERDHTKQVKEGKYFRRECVYGKFQRAFSLPERFDAEKISANFKDGVLTVEIPKPEQVKPKQITVQ